jgi:hypothetical protein
MPRRGATVDAGLDVARTVEKVGVRTRVSRYSLGDRTTRDQRDRRSEEKEELCVPHSPDSLASRFVGRILGLRDLLPRSSRRGWPSEHEPLYD